MTQPYATPPTAVAGQTLSAVNWNTKIRDSLENVAKPVRCIVSRAVAQSIPNNAITGIIWDTEELDTDSIWTAGANASRLTVPVAGTYLISAHGNFAANATGVRLVAIVKNGVTYLSSHTDVGSAAWLTGSSVTALDLAAAGDYYELIAYQTSGAALSFGPDYAVRGQLLQVAR